MVHPKKYAEGRRTTKKMVCRVCLKDHPLRFCSKFLQVDYQERMQLVTIYKYCAGCLSHDHTWRTCESTGTCKRCGDSHHTLLHKSGKRPRSSAQKSVKRLQGPSSSNRPQRGGPSSSRDAARGPRSSDGHGSERPSSSQALVLSHSRNRKTPAQKKPAQSKSVTRRIRNTVSLPTYSITESILLRPTAIIRIVSNERYVSERALIDPGSECSVISLEMVRRLGARTVRVGNKERCFLKIGGGHGISTTVETYAEVRPKYRVVTPAKSLDSRIMDEFPGLQLADPQFHVAAPVNILLGGDVYSRIIRNGVSGGSFGKPLAQFTIFGYIISGSCTP